MPKAEDEASTFVERCPGTLTIAPLYEDVVACLGGRPAVDVLHVALHG